MDQCFLDISIYIQKEFQNFIGRSLCNCYEQLLHIYHQSINMKWLMIVESMIPETYSKFYEYLVILAPNEPNNLLICKTFGNINCCRILENIFK